MANGLLGIFELARQDDPSAQYSQGYPREDADVADEDPVGCADEEQQRQVSADCVRC